MPLLDGMPRTFVALAAVLVALLVPNASAGAEDAVSYDQRVLAALDLLDHSASTAPLRGVLDSNRVTVQFVAMAPGVYARYSVARHTIEIDQRWSDAETSTLAAVIAHEATHAADAVSGYLASGGASACIDSEVRAFHASASFWLTVYGPLGKPIAEND